MWREIAGRERRHSPSLPCLYVLLVLAGTGLTACEDTSLPSGPRAGDTPAEKPETSSRQNARPGSAGSPVPMPHERPSGPLPPPYRVPAAAGKYEPRPATLVPPPPGDGPFNVVFISLDTVRADALGCYGHPAFRTPAIDGLAASGAQFAQAITHIPETALSHWAIFTSVEPPLHGNVNRNGTSRYVGPLAQEIFKAHGYTTGAVIGGVTLRSDVGLHRGFDTYDEDFAFSTKALKRPGGEVTERAVAFIRAHGNGPFFLFVHYFDAHFPYQPPPPFDTLYDPGYHGDVDGSDEKLAPYRDGNKPIADRDLAHVKALYGGEISFLDAQVKTLSAALAETGAKDRTLVVLFSDHGESFEHDYYFNHARVLYDATLHVPLIIAFPGVVLPGVVVETQVRTIDILPTVLELLGIPGDVKFQGQSLAPLLHGLEQHLPSAFSLTDPWRPSHLESVRSEGWKLILGPNDRQTLFDLAQDAGENHPIEARDHPIAKVLRDEHLRHKARLAALESRMMGPPPPPRPELSPQEIEQLKRLGYVR